MRVLSLGVVRGLIAQIVGTTAGMALVIVVRLAAGVPVWSAKGAEAAIVVGAMLGEIAFLARVGVFDGWWHSLFPPVEGHGVRGQEMPEHHGPPPGQPAWTRYFGADTNHRVIGVQYVMLGTFLLVFGGSLAVAFRTQLAQAELSVLGPAFFNSSVGVHGFTLIAATLIGSAGVANYLIPLLIGAADMAFPRLNAFAFWVNVPASLLLIGSLFIGGWDTGWTAYPPLSVLAPVGMQLYFVAVFFIGVSSIAGSVNFLATIVTQRAPGMTAFRMPIFLWGMVATGIVALTATQLIALSFLMVMMQRLMGMGFFDPAQGGNPVLFQHLFWFYSHPAVYVFVLPGLGLISEILPVFCRKPLFGYKWVALSSLGIALAGMLVWAHHMFAAGMESFLRVPFMITTLIVAVPTGVKIFSWLATVWRGKLTFPTPMLFTLGAISVFLIGGLTGPTNGLVTTDLYVTDTYWLVGHFHATLFGGFVFPFFAALYFWFPRLTGRMYSERLGRWHFWLMLPAFWVQTLGQSYVGLHGMRRRIVTYEAGLNIGTEQLLISIAGLVIAVSVAIMLYNLIRSARSGPKAERNPWRSRSPEWQLPVPIPEVSYAQPPQVVGEPYDYGLPGSAYVVVPRSAGGE